jgi:hypothetical protein
VRGTHHFFADTASNPSLAASLKAARSVPRLHLRTGERRREEQTKRSSHLFSPVYLETQSQCDRAWYPSFFCRYRIHPNLAASLLKAARSLPRLHLRRRLLKDDRRTEKGGTNKTILTSLFSCDLLRHSRSVTGRGTHHFFADTASNPSLAASLLKAGRSVARIC